MICRRLLKTKSAMPAPTPPLIEQFLQHLWLERGLSDNTRAAYRRDLLLFHNWLERQQSNDSGLLLANRTANFLVAGVLSLPVADATDWLRHHGPYRYAPPRQGTAKNLVGKRG